MEQGEQKIHFGLNCRHLKRDEFPADGRCALAIPRYAGPEYAFLDTRTPVSVKAAARLLGMSEEDVVRRAKAGEFEWFFPENIAKRVTIYTKTGECQVTLNEAAKRLHKTPAEIEQQVAAGEMTAEYPDVFMRIVLTTRWDAEKCPLLDSGGVCYHFQPHDGPQIRCLAEASRLAGEKLTEIPDELDSHRL